MNAHPNRYVVEFDSERDAYVIDQPDRDPDLLPMIVIRRDTLESMTLKEASEFIGSRLVLLTPELKEMFKDYLWTNDGQTPPKRS
jgi:hypothetical protein